MSKALVTIDAAPRGTDPQQRVQFYAAEVVITKSWGLQPATALIDWVSAQQQADVIAGASLTIQLGGHTFYGICQSLVPTLSPSGHSLMQEFKDSREYLMWDLVYCAFNIRDARMVNGRFVRRYWHILPANFNSRTRTYTNTPYTARQILDFLFSRTWQTNGRIYGSTIETPWNRQYHPALDWPVYDLDYESGRYLGQAVQEISERVGLTFTLGPGRYDLWWALKGVGEVPDFPVNASNRRGPGVTISGNPTRIRLIGDRNKYQVLNIDLEPDWKPAWQNFYDFHLFISDLYDHETVEAAIGGIPAGTPYNAIAGDTGGLQGWQLASARAQTITVGQYADLRNARDGGGEAFRDYRKIGGRARQNLPVALYLRQILFRAFRIPASFYIVNAAGFRMGLTALDLADRGLVEVTHDPATGQMSCDVNALRLTDQPGYAIVKGFQVSADGFKTLNPQYFNLNAWLGHQAVWQSQSFQTDDSGEGDLFVLFDDPVINSGDLISQATIDGVLQTYADGRPKVALRSGATVTTPPVRVALTFSAEKYSYVAGQGTRDGVENGGGISAEYVLANGVLQEIPYADGSYAADKAAAALAPLLNRQYYFVHGGYTVEGSNATQLTAMLDRVTVRYSASGITEEVDFTNERSRNVTVGPGGQVVLQVEPEREYARRAQLAPLFPGQAALRAQARQAEVTALLFRQNPKLAQTLMDTFYRLLGMANTPDTQFLTGDYTDNGGALPAGTPLFRNALANSPQAPDDTGTATTGGAVYAGATIVDGEPADGAVRSTRTGDGHTALIRVKGPVALNAPVGAAPNPDFPDKILHHSYLSPDPQLPVGQVQEAWSTNEVRLVPVQLTGAGGEGSNGHIRGEYYPGANADTKKDDVWTVSYGVNQGSYAATMDNPPDDPVEGGIGWTKLADKSQNRWT